ncbi:MAG: hypothetical protein ACTS73_04930 [Arsenophonus sp. NEOnobi-MAG3]
MNNISAELNTSAYITQISSGMLPEELTYVHFSCMGFRRWWCYPVD